MGGNTRLALLVLGVLVGGVVGYVTRPQAAEIRLGGASFEIENTGATASDASALTTGQLRRVFVFAVVGGAIGLLAGVVADRRR